MLLVLKAERHLTINVICCLGCEIIAMHTENKEDINSSCKVILTPNVCSFIALDNFIHTSQLDITTNKCKSHVYCYYHKNSQ